MKKGLISNISFLRKNKQKMPPKYESNRDKVRKYVKNKIIPYIKNGNSLDYYDVIKVLISEFGVKKQLVEEVLQGFIDVGTLREIRRLDMTDEALNKLLQKMREKEKEAKEIKKETDEILTNEILKDGTKRKAKNSGK